jgi:MFS family permease
MKIKNYAATYTGLPGSIYILLFARIVTSIGNFVFPFMTLLLTSKGGMGEEEAGVYLLFGALLQIPGSLLGGKLADVCGRKKIMTLFMGLAGLCFIPCAFIIDSPDAFTYIPWLLIASSFFNSASHPASTAMVNDLTRPFNRQAAFSLLYMGMNFGIAIGSIVAGFLFNNYVKLLFLGDALTTFLSIMLLIFFVHETRPSKDEMDYVIDTDSDEKAVEGGIIKALLKRPVLLVFALIDTVYTFVYAQTNFSIPLKANAVFGQELGPKYYGTLNMINCLQVIFLTTILTMATKKIKAVYNVAIAGLFYAIGFGMLVFVNGFFGFALSTVIWTTGEIISATNVGVYIANHTPVSHRGRFNSLINIISGIGSAISPYVMGGFIVSYGVNRVWPLVFVLALGASCLMLMLGKAEKAKVSDKA